MRIARIVLIVLLAVSIIWLVPSELAMGEELLIPLDQKTMEPVNEVFYTSETSYSDPTLQIEISGGSAYGSDYIVARIRIANPTQLRSYVHRSSAGDYPDRMAERQNMVLAITGDSFRTNTQTKKNSSKYVIRQGETLLTQNWREDSFFDILMIDDQGDFHILKTPTREEVDAFLQEHTIWQSFCFGPGLIIDGTLRELENKDMDRDRRNAVGWDKRAQRICICQMDKLSYMVVVTGGPDNPGNKGMLMDEFIQVILSEGRPMQVYNLDGGNSAWLVFHNEKINRFGRGRSQGRRKIEDVLYFASAWQGDPPAVEAPAAESPAADSDETPAATEAPSASFVTIQAE